MIELHERCIEEYLIWQGIDISKPNFKEPKAYNKIKDRKALNLKNNTITLEKYIEEYLLRGKHCVVYESKYDMDCPYDSEYMYSEEDMAQKILMAMGDFPEDTDVNDEKSIEAGDMIEAGRDLVKAFHRRDCGLIDRLKKYFKFDLTLFDTKDDKYEYEKCKILYFFYMLEKMYFPDTNVLELLSKPSIESISATYNGMIIEFIEMSLRKELGFSKSYSVRLNVNKMVGEWDDKLREVLLIQDKLYSMGFQFNFEDNIISALKLNPPKICDAFLHRHISSPIESLYLKAVGLMFVGKIKDIADVNDIKKNYYVDISDEMIEEMQTLYKNKVDVKKIEQHIMENAKRLSKYVYLKPKTSGEEVRKIKKSGQKVSRFYDFVNAEYYKENTRTELDIVSVLQAVILDDQNETFDYSYHASQNQMKHKPRVQGALKNDNYVVGALKIYWQRKVVDRWYINLGRGEQRIRCRAIEQVCDNIRLEILSQDSQTDMVKLHDYYMREFEAGLNAACRQINGQIGVIDLIEYVKHMGFENVDNSFYNMCPYIENEQEIAFFQYIIDCAIKQREPDGYVDYKGKKFVFTFDYEKRTCSLSIQEISLDEKG